MFEFIFYMVLFFCFSGVAGSVIYLHFFKNECKENHKKNSKILGNVLKVIFFLLTFSGIGKFFSQLIKQ